MWAPSHFQRHAVDHGQQGDFPGVQRVGPMHTPLRAEPESPATFVLARKFLLRAAGDENSAQGVRQL
jgi:hypothetical protein